MNVVLLACVDLIEAAPDRSVQVKAPSVRDRDDAGPRGNGHLCCRPVNAPVSRDDISMYSGPFLARF